MTDSVQSDARKSKAWTPGPWKFNQAFAEYQCSTRDNDVPGAEVDVPEHGLHSGWRSAAVEVWGPEAKANALLIAAAPDLYEALREAADLCVGTFAEGGSPHKRMLAALASARGEGRDV